MKKAILVVTHERSGTHLLINMINYRHNGDFSSIGRLPSENIPHTIEVYKDWVYKYILTNRYSLNVVSKSHHQVEFYTDFIDFLFENYYVIYLKRDIKDVLVSYYKFLNSDEKDHKPIPGFPEFKDWVFMNPEKVGYKYFANYPDPHVVVMPCDYIERIYLHTKGWEKYSDEILTLNYEDILMNYSIEKAKIESYIGIKISEKIPDINDKNLPNFYPNKGIIGAYKDFMSKELIEKINSRLSYL